MKIYLAEKAPNSLAISIRCFEGKEEGSAYSLEGDGAHVRKISKSEIGKASMGMAFAFKEEDAITLVRKWFSDSAAHHEEEARHCRTIANSKVEYV